MGGDVAAIGLSVDSGQVKAGAADLDTFSQAAARAERSSGAFDAAAKRLGLTTDQYRQKVAALNQDTDRFANTNNKATTSNTSMAASAVRMLGSYNGISLILQGITAASSAYFALTAANGPDLEKNLEEQARLIGLIKDAYRDATDKAGTFYNSSKAILKLQAELNINDLQSSIRGQIAEVLKGSVGMTSDVDIMGNSLGTGTLNSAGLGPFKQAVDDLMGSISSGGPAIEAFRNTIAEIGNSDPALKTAAGTLLAASQAAGDTADKLNAAQRALRLLNGTATPEDRAGLGLSNRVKSAPRDPFDSQVTSINKHIATLRADAAAVGESAGTHARLRVEAQLLEAAQQKGGTATAAQTAKMKELGLAASDAAMSLERARVGDQIKFGRATSMLSPEDAQIASQLRGLYPDVATGLASVEAQGLRTNAVLSGLSSSISGNLTTGLTDAIDGTKSFGSAMADTSKMVIRAIEEMIVKTMIIGPLLRGLQGSLTGGGGGLLSMFGLSGSSAGGELAGFGTSSFIGPTLAGGGAVWGAGTATSDSIPAMLSHGEFVVRASSVARPGVREHLERLNSGIMAGFATGGFAPGAECGAELILKRAA